MSKRRGTQHLRKRRPNGNVAALQARIEALLDGTAPAWRNDRGTVIVDQAVIDLAAVAWAQQRSLYDEWLGEEDLDDLDLDEDLDDDELDAIDANRPERWEPLTVELVGRIYDQTGSEATSMLLDLAGDQARMFVIDNRVNVLTVG